MSDETFEGWAILELMGHRRLTGYVREVEVAGAGMLRLDVPAEEHGATTCEACGADSGFGCICQPALGPLRATQFYSPAALYCLTPTTEEMARKLATTPMPAHRWEIERPALTEGIEDGELQADPDEVPF